MMNEMRVSIDLRGLNPALDDGTLTIDASPMPITGEVLDRNLQDTLTDYGFTRHDIDGLTDRTIREIHALALARVFVSRIAR